MLEENFYWLSKCILKRKQFVNGNIQIDWLEDDKQRGIFKKIWFVALKNRSIWVEETIFNFA